LLSRLGNVILIRNPSAPSITSNFSARLTARVGLVEPVGFAARRCERVQRQHHFRGVAALDLGVLRSAGSGARSPSRRQQSPKAVRPARPLRWSAEARLVGS
jgi:hypothetical protein